jgi:hypothetical protein
MKSWWIRNWMCFHTWFLAWINLLQPCKKLQIPNFVSKFVTLSSKTRSPFKIKYFRSRTCATRQIHLRRARKLQKLRTMCQIPARRAISSKQLRAMRPSSAKNMKNLLQRINCVPYVQCCVPHRQNFGKFPILCFFLVIQAISMSYAIFHYS